jgi:peptide/nickel transport system substrate-binding protein
MAGTVDMTYHAVEFGEAMVVREEWARSGDGTVWLQPNQLRMIQPQMRADYARPVDLLNRDVRHALAYGMDRPAIAEAANPGAVMVVDSDGVPGTRFGDAIRSKAFHYDYDPNRAQSLLEDAGWRRGADGILEKAGQPFRLALLADRGSEQNSVFSVMHENYRQIGIDLSFTELGPDVQQPVTYSGIRHRGAFTNEPRTVQAFHSARIASAETRWTGPNFSGYANPATDRAIDTLERSVRSDERQAALADVWRMVSEDAGSIGLYIRPLPYLVRKGITGPIPASLSGSVSSNVQSWDVN